MLRIGFIYSINSSYNIKELEVYSNLQLFPILDSEISENSLNYINLKGCNLIFIDIALLDNCPDLYNQMHYKAPEVKVKIVSYQKALEILVKFYSKATDLSEIIYMFGISTFDRSYINRCINTKDIILLSGKTGCGKSTLAKSIHRESIFNKGQFVQVNCNNLNGDLFDSTLFGHVKGAFTSANFNKHGLVEEAMNGVLFLDEVLGLSSESQAKLLVFLDSQKYRPLGASKEKQSNIKIIMATNDDIINASKESSNRLDFLYRIGSICVNMNTNDHNYDYMYLMMTSILYEFKVNNIISDYTIKQNSVDCMMDLLNYPNFRVLRDILHKCCMMYEKDSVVYINDIVIQQAADQSLLLDLSQI